MVRSPSQHFYYRFMYCIPSRLPLLLIFSIGLFFLAEFFCTVLLSFFSFYFHDGEKKRKHEMRCKKFRRKRTSVCNMFFVTFKWTRISLVYFQVSEVSKTLPKMHFDVADAVSNQIYQDTNLRMRKTILSRSINSHLHQSFTRASIWQRLFTVKMTLIVFILKYNAGASAFSAK